MLLDSLVGLGYVLLNNVQNRRPSHCDGYTINYSEPYYEPCPFHGCTTYQTVEDSTLCYCPKCKRLLVHR